MAGSVDDDAFTTHGCLATAKWGFTLDESTGRWSTPQQAIKPRRFSLVTDQTDPNNDGHGLRKSKLKIRGHGEALSIRYDSQDGKDFQILGWTIPFMVETEA